MAEVGASSPVIIHDWLTSRGGAERVLESVLGLFPSAPIYTLVYRPDLFQGSPIAERRIHTSFLQRFPFSKTRYRSYLPLMPLAIEQFDLSGHDLILSLSDAVAHGVLPQPDQLHVNYIFTPMRYAWSLQHLYLQSAGLARGVRSWAARALLHYLRQWDLAASKRVDHFVAISHWVARRVWRIYRRRAEVIYPPVAVERFQPLTPRDTYYLTVGRLVPYKRFDLIVEAFARLGRPLMIVGDGPERARLVRQAPANVQLLGWQAEAALAELYGRARAFVYMAEEDFGLAPIEAQAGGAPVIAFGRGGVAESVTHGETGVLFGEQTVESLVEAIRDFEDNPSAFRVNTLRRSAERFRAERFEKELAAILVRLWDAFEHGV